MGLYATPRFWTEFPVATDRTTVGPRFDGKNLTRLEKRTGPTLWLVEKMALKVLITLAAYNGNTTTARIAFP